MARMDDDAQQPVGRCGTSIHPQEDRQDHVIDLTVKHRESPAVAITQSVCGVLVIDRAPSAARRQNKQRQCAGLRSRQCTQCSRLNTLDRYNMLGSITRLPRMEPGERFRPGRGWIGKKAETHGGPGRLGAGLQAKMYRGGWVTVRCQLTMLTELVRGICDSPF